MTSKSSTEPRPLHAAGALAQMKMTPRDIARKGWHVMISGEAFNAVCELLDKLVQDGTANAEGLAFLNTLHARLVGEAQPYKPKPKVSEPKIEVVPGLPPGMR